MAQAVLEVKRIVPSIELLEMSNCLAFSLHASLVELLLIIVVGLIARFLLSD